MVMTPSGPDAIDTILHPCRSSTLTVRQPALKPATSNPSRVTLEISKLRRLSSKVYLCEYCVQVALISITAGTVVISVRHHLSYENVTPL